MTWGRGFASFPPLLTLCFLGPSGTISVRGMYHSQESAPLGTFCQPKKNNEEDIDAVWLDKNKGVVFLQITIAAQHPLKGKRLKELMKALNAETAQLWFVTTEENAPNYRQRQRIVTQKREEYQAGNEPQVEQSVAVMQLGDDTRKCGEEPLQQ